MAPNPLTYFSILITMDGKEIALAPGRYAGKIVLTVQ